MIRVVSFLAVCCLFGMQPAYGQVPGADMPRPSVETQIGIGWGYQQSRVQDLLFSPLIYDGGGALAPDLFYRRNSDKGALMLRIGFDKMSVESTDRLTFPFFDSSITRQSSTASFVNLRLGYAREVLERGSLDLLLGGMLDNQIHILEYRFSEFDDEGYLIAYALAAWARGRYRIDARQTLTGQVSYPVAAFVSRPPFAVVDNESIQTTGSDFGQVHGRGTWHAFGGFTKWHFTLGYERVLTPRFNVELSYHFDYLEAPDPQQLAILRNGVNVAIVLGF